MLSRNEHLAKGNKLPDGLSFQELVKPINYMVELSTIKSLLYFMEDKEVYGRFYIPSYQRPFVWTEEQQVALIESILKGIPIGTYFIAFSAQEDSGPAESRKQILLDGQQRITTIVRFVNDKFPVFGMKYSEWPYMDMQDHFLQAKFSRAVLNSSDEEEMEKVYRLLAFGGTPNILSSERKEHDYLDFDDFSNV
jgi:hypothetical protein